MREKDEYDFAFTTASLRLRDMHMVAKANLTGEEVDIVNDLGGGKSSTGRKLYGELRKRISSLTPKQQLLLVHGSLATQKQVAFLAVCKTYEFIKDFAFEVVQDKFVRFDEQISAGDYLSFYRRKFQLHERMETLTSTTQNKIRQLVFKMLEEAGLINNTQERIIQPQFIEDDLVEAIKSDNPQWLKVLLFA